MKKVSLFILLLALVSFATISCSYADSSPPGIEISIENDYELLGNIDLIETNFTGVAGTIEGRIAVYDCDLKCWPGNESSIYNLNNIARVNSICDIAVNNEAINKNNPKAKRDGYCNQYRLYADKNEVLSLFYTSKGDRFSARNEVT